ncbi:preprotein translocase subunit SecE [Marinicella rhabdoformis]|uniref:preprotein translocase subunit SecE n=1 Tax=Marinicella rhabdoformis TaxID=2580566 RepID=UPI0015D046E9|nr:preprotein translocase subunit SecE [Marinicella rhabdoformis]
MSQVDTTQSGSDQIKWYIAIAVIIAGVAANLYFVDQFPTVVRAMMVIGGVVLGAVIGYSTPRGKEFAKFVKNANIERQKIVWPTKNETVHTTLIVLALVIVFGLFLFLVDSIFSNLVEYFFE